VRARRQDCGPSSRLVFTQRAANSATYLANSGSSLTTPPSLIVSGIGWREESCHLRGISRQAAGFGRPQSSAHEFLSTKFSPEYNGLGCSRSRILVRSSHVSRKGSTSPTIDTEPVCTERKTKSLSSRCHIQITLGHRYLPLQRPVPTNREVKG
jgi:hypothetical protein